MLCHGKWTWICIDSVVPLTVEVTFRMKQEQQLIERMQAIAPYLVRIFRSPSARDA